MGRVLLFVSGAKVLPQPSYGCEGEDAPRFHKKRNEVRMKTKRKNKYTELRAAIAAVRKVNKRLLRVLPQWPEGWGAKGCRRDGGSTVKENVAAFFREHGKEGEEAVAAFLDALARFTFDEFPRNWPEVWRMVHSSREIQWRLRRHFPDNAFFDRVFHDEMGFFKAITPTARKERSRAYWELLRKIAGYSRRVLAQMGENAVRSLEGERLQPMYLAEIGDGALKKIMDSGLGIRDWPDVVHYVWKRNGSGVGRGRSPAASNGIIRGDEHRRSDGRGAGGAEEAVRRSGAGGRADAGAAASARVRPQGRRDLRQCGIRQREKRDRRPCRWSRREAPCECGGRTVPCGRACRAARHERLCESLACH